ncbi:MAG: fumarylacetoacetase [Patiriisocius sp.]|jgi:fumarylacetoacetase
MIEANDPKHNSWVNVPENSHFPIQNLPFGIFSTDKKSARVGVALGEEIIDLLALSKSKMLNDLHIDSQVFAANDLNALMKYGKFKLRSLRNALSRIFRDDNVAIKLDKELRRKILVKQSDATLHLPVTIGDYTDFYSSIEHATNVGKMFRDPENALLPNWKHIPVGYHGRSSSVVVSGVDFHRPKGQMKANDADVPSYGPCRLMDFELEMGFITFDGKPMGQSIKTSEADDHIFGMCLFNDWSARDIQKWEYVPLGPFLGKNFASHVSPWIVTLDALEPFRVAGPKQDVKVLPYLEFEGEKNIDIDLEVFIQPPNQDPVSVSKSNYKYMYWNMNQQLAHHSVNGCNIRCGDLLASGTISGKEPGSYGSMLEISWQGTKPVAMPDGTERKFINDNDTVIMTGSASKDGITIGFGDVTAKVLPSI